MLRTGRIQHTLVRPGGFTFTGRYVPNAFNVTPVIVYRVYTDGRPMELVRGVDLIGTLDRPTSGTVTIEGKNPREVPHRIGWVTPDLALYAELTAAENLAAESVTRIAAGAVTVNATSPSHGYFVVCLTCTTPPGSVMSASLSTNRFTKILFPCVE